MSSENMVLMYGVPPDMDSPRFKPIKPMEPQVLPGQVGPFVPSGVQGIPPVTHNPFTGEPINLLEVLAQNARLAEENAQLEKQMEGRLNELGAICDSRLNEIKHLQEQHKIDAGTIHTLETKVHALEFQRDQKPSKKRRK
jgi:hypothetical protein